MMRLWSTALVLGFLAGPASAQLLGGGGGLGGLGGLGQLPSNVAGGLLPNVAPLAGPGVVGSAVARDPLGVQIPLVETLIPDAPSLLDIRRERLRGLLHDNPRTLEADPAGNPVRRNEILATNPTAAETAAAVAAGFTVVRDEVIDGVGAHVVVLRPPPHLSLKRAMAALHAAAPAAVFDYNSVFEPAGGPLRPRAGPRAEERPSEGASGVTIGMVDGGVGAHPAFAAARIEQRGFAGAVAATGHGTADASLLVGSAPGFHGAAEGARLLVADVYGGSAANGSAEAISRAIGWLAARGARVINISLVGPPNAVLAATISAAQARGVLVVAAVGNDGPAAPPMYPASYPRVIAVTGVDGKDRALIEAGRALHVDFAAPGADMAAALPGGGYAPVRGTSFAAPLVAARLAAYPANAVESVAAEARPGRGGAVGRGVVCETCRNDPRKMEIKNPGRGKK